MSNLWGRFLISFLFFISTALAGPIPPSIETLLTRMEAMQERLGENSGIGKFNYLYRITTKNMGEALSSGKFQNQELMERFTHVFASYYFNAVEAHLEGRKRDVPEAWKPLFKNNTSGNSFKNWQYAGSGMYAHIGRDLPLVLTDLFASQGRMPGYLSKEFKDFLKFNDVLRITFKEVEPFLFEDSSGVINPLIRLLSQEGVVPSLATMRTIAWNNAKLLFQTQYNPLVHETLERSIDNLTEGFAKTVFIMESHSKVCQTHLLK